ncbi:enolase C-terminal domain-like protein [Rhodopirellula sallentina]|uniref:Mandelate racemase/muconate lactonizing enzyme domain-containing protein n=1 Tax=Rhodopirellula sallentina SM41 TaxID=1263870 RepID=M5UHD0_9BACT|nr:enolase C-terminal domain-like protein [Rhodopirellula sallentina]EMI57236.1 mandelate racemase/muconate lactonizing enzyme domain-containing protein [Rhodopirellula sallentina SM41]
MSSNTIVIQSAEVIDLRVPTSDQLLGSDPFHKAPDYSSAVLHLETNTGLRGVSIVFTIGAGTDWICHGIRDLCQLIINTPLDEFTEAPIRLYRRLLDHHQLRWLHDGVFRMAAGAVLNALWDLWAKSVGKPLWKLLVDLDPQFIVDCIDWRNISDALTPDEALSILQRVRPNAKQRESELLQGGPKAYCTAGWLGLSDEEILTTIRKLEDKGFDAFKLKVGQDSVADVRRIRFMREAIDVDAELMVDANQYWGLDEAQRHIDRYLPFNLKWIEEPIARDDILGYIELAKRYDAEPFHLACGEHAASPVIFKQLLKSGSIGYCQIDAVRVAGVNDVMAIILMAAKFGVPVCPHGGGIALCNMIQHYAMWDQTSVSGHSDTQLVEYIDFLQDAVQNPVQVRDGRYVSPTAPGWGLEFRPDFVQEFQFPDGIAWNQRDPRTSGVRFEVPSASPSETLEQKT